MRLQIEVTRIRGQGVDIQRAVDGLKGLKADLQSLGCKVSVKIAGEEIEAGNGTRTRDILLGKKSVTLLPQDAATDDPAKWEQCGNCGEFRIKFLCQFMWREGVSETYITLNGFQCLDCGHVWTEPVEEKSQVTE